MVIRIKKAKWPEAIFTVILKLFLYKKVLKYDFCMFNDD